MAISLLDKRLIVARLKDQVEDLRSIQGAAEYAAARADLRNVPAAFVIESANRPGPSRTGTLVVSQNNVIGFGIVLAQDNKSDPRGAAAGDSLQALRVAVMTALLGWVPDTDYDPCEYAGGRLLAMNDFTIWWQDDYATSSLIRSV